MPTDLLAAPVVDVRPLLTAEREQLLDFLGTLAPEAWETSTAAGGWRVKDQALHLLDDDFGWLSRGRDRDRSGLLTMDDDLSFVTALAAKNQRWIDGARGLSPRVIVDLLRWSGQQMDSYYATMDLLDAGEVVWVSEGPVPVWFDIAQDLTERWVHQMQMREAVDRVEDYAERYLPVVLRTFIWALPHQYRVLAPRGTTVQVDLAPGGIWRLENRGSTRWELDEGPAATSHASARFVGDAAWRWMTGAHIPSEGLHLSGPPELCQPLLSVRGIIV